MEKGPSGQTIPDTTQEPISLNPADASLPDSSSRTKALPEASEALPVDEETFTKVRDEINEERRWKSALDAPTNQFYRHTRLSFDTWGKILIQASAANQREEVDRLCLELIALRDYWGPSLFPPQRYDSFLRDRFWVGPSKVEGAQFFEATPFYTGDDRIMKLFRFSVFDGNRVVIRYYLERTSLTNGKALHLLTRHETRSGDHQQIQIFVHHEESQPTYWQLRERVIGDLLSHPEKSQGGHQ